MNNAPIVELKHFAVASADHAKAVIRVTHRNGGRDDKELVTSSIRRKLGNKIEPVRGTFKAIASDAFSDTLIGIVRVVRPTVPYIEGQTPGFTCFASNMFMDTEKSIWALKHTESGNLLVQTSNVEDEETLNELMSSFSSANSRFTPEHRGYVATASALPSITGGDLIAFVNKNSEPSVGYIVATVQESEKEDRYMVLENGAKTAEVIASTLILEKFDASNAPKLPQETTVMHSILAASKSGATLDDMLSYYKQMFKADPSYYEKFAANLKAHAFL